MGIEILKQRHTLVHRSKVHLDKNGTNGSAREHLTCALEDAFLCALHVDLQNIDCGYPMGPAKVVNRVRLDFDRLAGVRLSPQQRMCDARGSNIELGLRNSIRERQRSRMKPLIVQRTAKRLVCGRKGLKRPYIGMWIEPSVGLRRLPHVGSHVKDCFWVGDQTALMLIRVPGGDPKGLFR